MTPMLKTFCRRAPRAAIALATFSFTAALAPHAAQAQWVTTHEQFYLEAPHNWEFRNNYQAADRLFNAFDYGHAILYELLWTKPGASPAILEEAQYDYLTKKVLVRPPRVPLEEAAIEVAYVKLAPEAKLMFEWAHILHRQMYDVLADQSLDDAQRDAEVARLLAYYKTRPDLAFSSKPKSMALMQEQPYSLAFRQNYPKFNGLIWGYHWLQVGLYEPLMVYTTTHERQAGVRATVARFWQMLEDPPRTMPHQMPMTAAIAPRFSERYPEAAIIFDNLHSMHDVISDILANDAVPRDRKRAEILRAAALFRDDTSYVMSPEAWKTMTAHMGIENMGGPAVGFLPQLPQPTVTYGAVMTHDDRTGAMTGFKYGSAIGGAHAAHGAAPADTAGHAAHAAPADTAGHAAHAAPADTAGHAAHAAPAAARDTGHAAHGAMGGGMPHDSGMMQLHMRMMRDSVIHARIMADTAMHRMMMQMMQTMPPEHREHMKAMMHGDSARMGGHGAHGGHEPAAPIPVEKAPAHRHAAPARPATAKPAARPAARRAAPKKAAPTPAAKRPAPKPAPKPADPHAGHRPPA